MTRWQWAATFGAALAVGVALGFSIFWYICKNGACLG